MTRLITSTLSSKAQLTVPQEVRAALGLKAKGDLVGFLVDSEAGTVALARVEPTVADSDFTRAELRAILKLRGRRRRKGVKTMAALLRDLKR